MYMYTSLCTPLYMYMCLHSHRFSAGISLTITQEAITKRHLDTHVYACTSCTCILYMYKNIQHHSHLHVMCTCMYMCMYMYNYTQTKYREFGSWRERLATHCPRASLCVLQSYVLPSHIYMYMYMYIHLYMYRQSLYMYCTYDLIHVHLFQWECRYTNL